MLEHLRENLAVYAPIAAIATAVALWASIFTRPLPPRALIMAAGPSEGAYYQIAKRYRDVLQREGGIKLEILATRGSIENLELLRADPPRADVAIIQGGVGASGEDEALENLGSIFYEPVFLFARRALGIERPSQLRGKRIAIGPEGSGTRALALQLLDASGVGPTAATLLPLGGAEARTALLRGNVDAAFFVIAYPLPTLAEPFRDPEIALVPFLRADAYRKHFPFLSTVTLPAGAISLADDVPSQDMALLAPAAQLVVREDVHSALKNLLVRIAREIHGGRQLFAAPGQFPSLDHLDYPLNSYARRFIESGPSIFARFLPFWVAVWGERLLILIIPLLGLAIPLMRLAPPVYRWRTERKIYRWYRQLKAIEREARQPREDATRREALLGELDALQRRVERVKVPLSYASQLYNLKLHMELVRRLLA